MGRGRSGGGGNAKLPGAQGEDQAKLWSIAGLKPGLGATILSQRIGTGYFTRADLGTVDKSAVRQFISQAGTATREQQLTVRYRLAEALRRGQAPSGTSLATAAETINRLDALTKK